MSLRSTKSTPSASIVLLDPPDPTDHPVDLVHADCVDPEGKLVHQDAIRDRVNPDHREAEEHPVQWVYADLRA